MVGDNIRALRTEKGMTQKEIADHLFVTAQAVSRWENGEVEPSLNTITKLAKIFEVSVDTLLGVAKMDPPAPEQDTQPEEAGDASEEASDTSKEQAPKTQSEETPPPQPEPIIQKEYVYKDPPKQVLALCQRCNRPIYNQKEIVRTLEKDIWCKACDTRVKNARKATAVKNGKRRRILSFVLGGALAAFWIIAGIVRASSTGSASDVLSGIVLGYASFALLSCWLLANNFVEDVMGSIYSWAFVTFPGIIFSFDLDGLIFLITLKILFFILGMLLSLLCGALALIIGGFISMFVYPYAIIKNFRRPEDNDIDLI